MKTAQAQLLPLARTLSAAAAASPTPVSANQGPLGAMGGGSRACRPSSDGPTHHLGVRQRALRGSFPRRGEVTDAVDAVAHPPRGPLGAAGYTAELTVGGVADDPRGRACRSPRPGTR